MNGRHELRNDDADDCGHMLAGRTGWTVRMLKSIGSFHSKVLVDCRKVTITSCYASKWVGDSADCSKLTSRAMKYVLHLN